MAGAARAPSELAAAVRLIALGGEFVEFFAGGFREQDQHDDRRPE
jgi:hypothetical protein